MKKNTAINDKERIRAWRKKNKMTPYALAIAAGLHKNTLRNIDESTWNPDTRTIEKCLKVVEPCK